MNNLLDNPQYDPRTDEGYKAIVDKIAEIRKSIDNGETYLPVMFSMFTGGVDVNDVLDTLYLRATDIHTAALKEREDERAKNYCTGKHDEEKPRNTQPSNYNINKIEKEKFNCILNDLFGNLPYFNDIKNMVNNYVDKYCNENKINKEDVPPTKEVDNKEDDYLMKLATEYLDELTADEDIEYDQYERSRNALVAFGKWVLARNNRK